MDEEICEEMYDESNADIALDMIAIMAGIGVGVCMYKTLYPIIAVRNPVLRKLALVGIYCAVQNATTNAIVDGAKDLSVILSYTAQKFKRILKK